MSGLVVLVVSRVVVVSVVVLIATENDQPDVVTLDVGLGTYFEGEIRRVRQLESSSWGVSRERESA